MKFIIVSSILATLLLISQAVQSQVITTTRDGRPIAIYPEPCTGGRPYSPAPGVKVYPSPSSQRNCGNVEPYENYQNQPRYANPYIPYYPTYPYLNRPISPAEGIGYGLGYILGK